jgi:hypothetical protein
VQAHALSPRADTARQPDEGAPAIPADHRSCPLTGFGSGAGNPQSATLKFHAAAKRVAGELEPVVAAEVIEAFPGDEVLGRAGREQEVFLGKFAEYPAALGPGPGCDRVRVASGGGMQQQRSVAVDRDPDRTAVLRSMDGEVKVPDRHVRWQPCGGRHQLAASCAWLALASSTRRSATGVVRVKSNRSSPSTMGSASRVAIQARSVFWA